jgi:cell division inhibitor SulA/protein ImuA
MLRRLQLAAEGNGTTLFLFRSARVAPASPAALRLHVSRTEGRTVVRILKRRGGGLPAPIALDLYSTYRRRRVGNLTSGSNFNPAARLKPGLIHESLLEALP